MTQQMVLVIPTYQAKKHLDALWRSIACQTLQTTILFIDSSSTDGTIEKLQALPVKLHIIPKKEFNHGGTRQLALNLVDADIYIYMTQDAILANPKTLENIIKCFEDPTIGCAYGRQLPHQGAGILGAHLRHFNYPPESDIHTLQDVPRLGIKTCANSDSFAAYRKMALEAVGGFPNHVIVGEDVYVAAKMLLAGWRVAYSAEAQVYHSHDYTIVQDLRRYFDIGAFHQMEHWILDTFKSPNKLGSQYVKSELKWCLQQKAYAALLASLYHSAGKWLGYRLGRQYQRLPLWVKKYCSMHRFFWT